MKKIEIMPGELMLLAGTRAMLGVGIGLLASECIPAERKKAVGRTLLTVGLVTTIPLVRDIVALSRDRREQHSAEASTLQ